MKIFTTTMLVLTMSTAAIMTTIAYASEHMYEKKGPSSSKQYQRHGQMQDMHELMGAMQAQMQAIHAEKDPEKRRQLMQAHRQSMHEGMSMMHDMGGKGMMGMMHGDGQKAKEDDGEDSDKSEYRHRHRDMDEHARMDHMEERMDMMQMMMEQMMQHEEAMHRHHHNQ